jgi:hypothetical protein
MPTLRWALAALLLGAVGLAVRAAAGDAGALWAALATTDPAKAEQVMMRMVAKPAQTVSFLQTAGRRSHEESFKLVPCV